MMRPHPKRTVTDPTNPRAWGVSDKNGMIGQHEKMVFQYQWAGTKLINTRSLVHPDEWDEPQRQLGTIILPPDPPPIMNARPENYSIDETPVSARTVPNPGMKGAVRVVVWNPAVSPYQPIRVISTQGDDV